MQIRSKLAVTVFSMLGAFACGDDDSGASGDAGGVSSSKNIADLSASEQKSLCQSLAAKFDKLDDAQTKLVCTTTSLGMGSSKEQCQSEVDACLKDGPVGDPSFDADCDDTSPETGVPADCKDVTVGELNDCIDATIAAFNTFANKVTCSTDLTSGDLGEPSDAPPSCAKIKAKCPEFDDMETP